MNRVIIVISFVFFITFSGFSDKNISKFPKEEMNKAVKEFQFGNFKESINSCLKILNSYPENDSSMLLLAYSYQNLKQYKKAEMTYIEILDLYPDNHYAKAKLSSLYNILINDALKSQNRNLAFSIVKRAQYNLPYMTTFYDKDADLNIEIENYEEAITLLKKSWDINPLPLEKKVTSELWRLNKIGNCFKRLGKESMNEWKDFIATLQKKMPDNNELMIMLANIYFYIDEEPVKRNALRNKAMRQYLTQTGQRLAIPVFPPIKGRWMVISGPYQNLLDTHNGYDAYCLDFSKIDENKNRIFKGTGNENSDYLSYGENIYAALDGTVEVVTDTAGDNIIGQPNFFSTNYIQLKHIVNGTTFYSVYYHLKKGSAKVSVGDTVKRGEVIAKIGNSGISYAPHLHFGLYDINRVSIPITFYSSESSDSDKITPDRDTVINY